MPYILTSFGRSRCGLNQPFRRRNSSSLAAKYDVAKRQSDKVHIGQRVERRWRLAKNGNAFGAEQFVEGFRRSRDAAWHNNRSATVKQCTPQFPNGKVEGKGVKDSPGVSRMELKRRLR